MPARVQITFGQPVDPHAFAEQNAAAAEANGTNGNGGNGSSDRNRRVELAMAEEMMLHWGRQIVAMAGRPDWPIEVAGRSRLASTRKENQ